MRPIAYHWLLAGLAAALLLALGLALQQGPMTLNWQAALFEAGSVDATILWQVRLPRALLAVAVGATLGLAGAALQGLLRNPLAGPDLIGVTSCAAFGAVITLYFGLAGLAWFALPAGGMVGAALAVLLIWLLAGSRGGALILILAGIAISSMVSALTALALSLAPNPFAMSEIVYWLLGSLANRSGADLAISLPFMATGWVLLLSCGRYLDALTLGEESARTLGFPASAARWRLVIGVALSVGAAVSVSGNIGFIGLVVPHLMRPWVGHRPGRLLAASALAGALLLLLADLLVQWFPTTQELKLGVITALLGGPFFLHLVYSARSRAA